MAVSLQNIRELCDDQLDTVMKVERFRKAVLEDIENHLVPFGEQIYARQVYQAGTYPQLYGTASNSKNMPLQSHGANNHTYGSMQQQMFYTPNMNTYGINAQRQAALKNQLQSQKNSRVNNAVQTATGLAAYQKSNGYQLKVGGVVVGSWATNRSQPSRNLANRTGMV